MKIKRSELESLKDFLYHQTQAFESDLAEAKSAAQALASSQALRGDVKTAINNELNYYNIPLLQGYADYSNLLYTEFDNLISDFESIVGETSATAVINSEALASLKQSLDRLHTSIVQDMNVTDKYYAEIADLISLKSPSKDKLSRAIETSKQSLSETEHRLSSFNSKQARSELEAILDNQNKGLAKVSGTVTMASPYRNASALDIYRNPHFKKAANRHHQKVDSLARSYFQKNHPAIAFDKDRAGIEELQTLAREVTKKAEFGGSISYGLENEEEHSSKQSFPSYFPSLLGAFGQEALKSFMTDKAIDAFINSSWEWLAHSTQNMQYGAVASLAGGGNYTVPINVNPTYSNFVGNFAKYGVPVLGGIIDFGMQVADGEDVGHAAVKATSHVAIGLGSAEIGKWVGGTVGAVAIPGLGAVPGAIIGAAAGFVIGVVGSMIFDVAYDNIVKPFIENPKKFVDDTVNNVKHVADDVGKTISDVSQGVGTAVSGFMNGLGNVFN